MSLLALYKARLRALRVSEESIMERIGSSLTQWGKPTEGTFRFVEKRLRELAGADTQRFYMVGDNPTSDMEGVRRANIFHRNSSITWSGVLVRTGVYKDGDETNGAVRSCASLISSRMGGMVPWSNRARQRNACCTWRTTKVYSM